MNQGYDLAEQRIREYQSRLRHFDELQERELKANLKKAVPMPAGLSPDWEIHQLRGSGPMGVWDAVAQDIEHALERWKI